MIYLGIAACHNFPVICLALVLRFHYYTTQKPPNIKAEKLQTRRHCYTSTSDFNGNMCTPAHIQNPLYIESGINHADTGQVLQSNASNHRIGEKSDLGDFERGTIVWAKTAGLSFSETAHLWGFLHMTVSRVHSMVRKTKQKNSQYEAAQQKKDQKRTARLVRVEMKTGIIQKSTANTLPPW